MNSKLIALGWLLLVSIVVAQEPISSEERTQTLAALDAWTQRANAASEMAPEEAFELLGTGIRKLSRPGMYPVDERLEVYSTVQKKLVSMPGHADYFGKRIQERTAAELAGERARSAERWWQYETLQQLPSPETVKILGELLSDERGKRFTDDPVRDTSMPEDNCRYAARSLAVLIDPVPYDPRLYPSSDAALDTWRLWYAQVKAGTRTFKFKGSPIEYTLAGPATAQARDSNADWGRTRNGKEIPTVVGDHPAQLTGTSIWVRIATILAALLVIVGGWLAFRKRTGT